MREEPFLSFKLAHKEYCNIFNQFYSRMYRKFKNDVLSDEDKQNVNKWLDEYIQQLHYATRVLSDIEHQINENQTLDITSYRQENSEITEKLKTLLVPLILFQFMNEEN